MWGRNTEEMIDVYRDGEGGIKSRAHLDRRSIPDRRGWAKVRENFRTKETSTKKGKAQATTRFGKRKKQINWKRRSSRCICGKKKLGAT